MHQNYLEINFMDTCIIDKCKNNAKTVDSVAIMKVNKDNTG